MRTALKITLGFKLSGFLAAMMLGFTTLTMPAQAPITVHGAVKNPAGFPITKGDVKFSVAVPGSKPSDPKELNYQKSYPIDAEGNYKSTDLAPGTFIAVVWSEGKAVDFLQVVVKAGEDKTVDFDMSRPEYLAGMSPEDRKTLEDYKKKNSMATADNTKIQNINAVMQKALVDQKAGKPDEAVASLQGVMSLRPDEPVLWQALGQAQLASADMAYKAAKAASQPSNSPEITQKYADAAGSYEKAIDLSGKSVKKPEPPALAVYYQNLGTALVKSGKLKEGADAFDMSAKTNPAKAADAYYSEAATLFNMNKTDDAGAVADKAIAADPKRPDPYYIKAQGMVQHATVDAKTQKIVLPPGCLEAYQEYLELAPDGQHATEVKEILTSMQLPIKNSFKAPGKKGG